MTWYAEGWYLGLERDRHLSRWFDRRIGLLLRRLGEAIVRRACGGHQRRVLEEAFDSNEDRTNRECGTRHAIGHPDRDRGRALHRARRARPRGHVARCAVRESSGRAADARDSERLRARCGGRNVTGAKAALALLRGTAALDATSAPCLAILVEIMCQ